MSADKAAALVKRGIDEARRVAEKALCAAARDLAAHEIAACAVLKPNPMPEWTTEEILAVHFRMHQAEGVLFPDALSRAAKACGLNLVEIAEKTLTANATTQAAIENLRKEVGAPWGRDQKIATFAAMTALAASR